VQTVFSSGFDHNIPVGKLFIIFLKADTYPNLFGHITGNKASFF